MKHQQCPCPICKHEPFVTTTNISLQWALDAFQLTMPKISQIRIIDQRAWQVEKKASDLNIITNKYQIYIQDNRDSVFTVSIQIHSFGWSENLIHIYINIVKMINTQYYYHCYHESTQSFQNL
ncbi:Hypothetical_protein [Hexamita inflata]|uniref:Hypothetical_protein n=1 Tax=Hexamita inflata TaxID=28002 RepID=A0AA86Q2U9_9EUKA|nr:Hypothetical protein HINF_LOCUS20945 [Hexamita inflata]CAI9933306.1 Hypothetical protein HINF_LOCUS20951 [Hexamita inflata]CAI9948558.1 Hypothetical protein HINF_LOCUS36203 [Hexamita inflata]